VCLYYKTVRQVRQIFHHGQIKVKAVRQDKNENELLYFYKAE